MDLADSSHRVARALGGGGETLAPQQLLGLDRRWLQALVLEYSGATSHAVILARSLGIPTLVGVKNARAHADWRDKKWWSTRFEGLL